MIFICGSLSCHDVTLNDRVKIMLSLLSWRIKAIYVYWSAVPPAEQPIGSRGQRFVFLSQKKKSCSLCFKNVNISHLYITCNLFLSSSSIVSSSFVCMAACGCSRGRCRLRLVCACVFTHASQMAKLSGKCNSQWTCNSWAAQEHEVLQASLLFNNIRITGLEVQLVRAVTRSLRSPFMRNIFEFHQLKKNK